MRATTDLILARCSLHAAAEDPDYRQTLPCGRHTMLANERAAHGGADAGPMPFEYLLSALGSCTSITLRMYAERKGWRLGTVNLSLVLHRSAEGDRIDRRIAVSASLSAGQTTRLAEICEKTPVTLTLKSGIGIRTAVEAGQQ
ncbi:MAG TPA: OsmC family protein [Burkholderiaceae bacterium]|nr:OsmC family protein [Burkholderiaceae bacterium]